MLPPKDICDAFRNFGLVFCREEPRWVVNSVERHVEVHELLSKALKLGVNVFR
jgi:hypothetical protein